MTIRHGAQISFLAVTCVIAGRSTIAQQPAVATAPQTVALSAAIPNDPQITTGRFANGLRYYIRTNKKPEKRAELRLVVNAGSMLEDRGPAAAWRTSSSTWRSTARRTSRSRRS